MPVKPFCVQDPANQGDYSGLLIYRITRLRAGYSINIPIADSSPPINRCSPTRTDISQWSACIYKHVLVQPNPANVLESIIMRLTTTYKPPLMPAVHHSYSRPVH